MPGRDRRPDAAGGSCRPMGHEARRRPDISRRERPVPGPRIARLPVIALTLLGLVLALLPRFAAAADPVAFAAAPLGGGPEVALADYRGEVVLLNGWATWCEPCKEEMPYLEQLSRDYAGSGLRVVGVSIDAGNADDRVAAFVEEAGITFPIWRDPGNAFRKTFATQGVPETVLIGRGGEEVYRWRGPMGLDPATDRAAIDAALAAQPGETPAGIPAAAPIAASVAFVAGVLSFLSPCVLPLIPTYAAVLTGLSLRDLSDRSPEARARARKATLTNGVAFVLGFSLVFIALGASATVIGGFLNENRVWIARVGGVLLAVLGLHLLGLLKLPWADRDFRLPMRADGKASVVGAFAVGIAFGAGWTPCIGPALAGILAIAASTASVAQGAGLLAVYSLGLAIPFLLATLLLDRFLAESGRVRRWLPTLQKASGVLVLLVAALLLTDGLSRLSAFLT